MALPKNVCGAERKLRLFLGVVLAVVAIRALERNRAKRGTAIWAVGCELLFNGLTQFCPLNLLLGRNTCSEVEEPRSRPQRLRERVRP